jgi:secernin
VCDTWVAMRDATLTHQVILGKNSDRPIFDCQPLLLQPRRPWPAGSTVQLEYVELPQVERTYATLGSSPYWCWGYEEGINEHGVAIGNEAIFSRPLRQAAEAYGEGRGPDLGLTGMDLVRLALERSRTAGQAVEQMGAWIEKYGQFGSGVPTRDHAKGGYDNAFIVADADEAWVLEGVGRRWLARQITEGYASISNQPAIRTEWDMGSGDVVDHAIEKGWWPPDLRDRFDFARAYVDERVPRHASHMRAMRTRQLLAEQAGRITPRWMMRIARDHYEGSFLGGPYFDAADPDFHSICMHVSPSGFTWGSTASSCIAVLPGSPDALPVFWWTPGPPCNGCYVPFVVHGRELPATVSRAGTFGKRVVPPPQVEADTFAPESYWWQFRRLMDVVKGDPIRSLPGYYGPRNRLVRARFDALEGAFAARLAHVLDEAAEARERGQEEEVSRLLDGFTRECVDQVSGALKELLSELG